MILEVNDLSFKYGKGPQIFEDVNFSISKREVISILGANGAGKSTLLSCIAGLLKPQSGQIVIGGKRTDALSMSEIARVIGYVPQIHVPAFAYSVIEFVVMGRTPYIGTLSKPGKDDYKIAEASLERLHISHLRDKPYTEISGGERQQVTIARALTQQPQILLLDEPTAHLDYGNQYRVVQLVKELADEGYGILMTTHNPDHAIILDGKVAIFERSGKLYIENAAELTPEILSDLYGLKIKTIYDEDAKRNICVVC